MLKRLLVDNALLGLQYAASALVPLFLIPHFVRTLGAAQYGSIAIAVAALSYAAIVVQYAFHLTGPAELARRATPLARKELFFDIACARLLLLVALLGLVFGASAVEHVLDKELPGETRVWFVLLGLPIGAALHGGWYLQATGRFGALSVSSIFATGVALIIGFAMVKDETSVSRAWAAAALAAGPLLVGAFTGLWSLLVLAGQPGRPNLGRARALLAHGREIFLSQLVAALYAVAGPIVVGIAAGPRGAGLYSAVERIAVALQSALVLTHTAAYPRLAALYPGARSDYLRLVRSVLGIYLFAALVLGVILAIWFDAISLVLLAEVNAGTAALLGWAWLWLALGIFGPLVTGYFAVCAQRTEILVLTKRVLLVSLPAGVLGVWAFGGAGWLAALCLGQVLVLLRALVVYRAEAGRSL